MEEFGLTDPEPCKQNLKNHCVCVGGGYKTRMSNEDSGNQFMKFQRGAIDNSIGNWPRGQFAILAKNLASFCLCLENLSDVELTSKQLIKFGSRNFKTS